jgi:hypothetical protein
MSPVSQAELVMMRLGAHPIDPNLRRVRSEEELAGLERAIEAPLPADYRWFLAAYGGWTFHQRVVFPILEPCPWGQQGDLDWFFAITGDPVLDIEQATMNTYAGRIPDETVPVAQDPGGNLVLLGVEGMVRGTVFFWDHERRELAGRMDDLVDDLEAAGEDLSRLDAAGIVRQWEQRFPDRLSKPAGYGNVYRVAGSFDEFLTALRVQTD